MRVVICLIAVSLCNSVHAQGLILRIPKEGSFATYETKTETIEAGKLALTLKGTVTLKSVAPPMDSPKKGRWVEIEFSGESLESKGIKTVIKKLCFNNETASPTWKDVKSIWKITVSADDKISQPVQEKPIPGEPSSLHAWIPPKPDKKEKLKQMKIKTVIGQLRCHGFKTTRTFGDGISYVDNLVIYTNDQCPFQTITYKVERSPIDERDLLFRTTAMLKKSGSGAKSRLKDKW